MVCTGRVGDGGTTTGLTHAHCPSTDAAVAANTTKGTLFGFVANTALGEVAVFRSGDVNGVRLLDLNKGSPGYNFIPVGNLPSDLKATNDGCRVISVNNGSCDLSVINVPAVMEVSSNELKSPSGAVVSQIIPHTSAGPLRARPQEMVLVPSSVPNKGTALCPQSGSYRAYISFPRCNLVAEVNLQTGKIIQGIMFSRDKSWIVQDPVCPVECIMHGDKQRADSGLLPTPPDAGPPEAGPTDSGVKDGKTSDTAPTDSGVKDGKTTDGPTDSGSPLGPLPHGLAITNKGERLYISSAGAGFLSVVDIQKTSGKFGAIRRIPTAGKAALTKIKLSPKTRQFGQYLYAIAQDRSVRVFSLSTTPEQECETNLDLAKVQDGGVPLAKARCFPLSRADAGGPARRVTETKAGIRFGTRMPIDVEFVQGPVVSYDAQVEDTRPHATPLQGIYAMVATSDGAVYVIDVEDWTLFPDWTKVKSDFRVPSTRLPHRFHNAYQGLIYAVPDASVYGISGAKTGGVPVVISKRKSVKLPGEGVTLRAPGETITQDWYMIYEQRLMARWFGNLAVDSDGLILDDRGANFCAAGILGRKEDTGKRPLRHGDILVLVGCKDDDECGTDQVCSKSPSHPSEYGLCLEASREEELFKHCSVYFGGAREFLVKKSKRRRLLLDTLPVEPQRVFLQQPPKNDCTSNAKCDPHFLCALEDQSSTGLQAGQCFRPGCEKNSDCGTGNECVSPLDGSPKVCSAMPLPLEVDRSKKCTTDADCRFTGPGGFCNTSQDCKSPFAECRKASSAALVKSCVDKGMMCSTFKSAQYNGYCVRTSPCFNELLRYDVRAGRSFIVGGYNRVQTDSATSECVENTNESRLKQNRVSVGLPVYPVLLGDQCLASAKPGDDLQPNPCFHFSPKTTGETYTGYTDKSSGTVYASETDKAPITEVRFSNPDIKFSVGLSHLQRFAKTASQPDGGAAASKTPPMPFREMTIHLKMGSGFARYLVNSASAVSLPADLVVSPDGFVYLVDQGDRSGSSGSSGQVLRIYSGAAIMDSYFSIR